MLNCRKNLTSKKFPSFKPYGPAKRVPTDFWWKNFDYKKENLKGGIYVTHDVAVGSVNRVVPSAVEKW